MKRALFCGVLLVLIGSLAFAQSPGGLGRAPFGSYLSANVDTLNLYNGNLLLDIPLFSLPGREGMSTDLRLTYNAQGWKDGSSQYLTYGYYVGGWKISNLLAGGGGTAAPYLIDCDFTGWPFVDPTGIWALDVTWTEANGAVHTYDNPTGITVGPSDGGCDSFSWSVWNSQYGPSGWLGPDYVSDESRAYVGTDGELRILLADGRTIIPGSRLESRNGNYADLDPYSALLADTVGRTVTYSSGSTSNGWYAQYTIDDAGGTARTYQLNWITCLTVHNPVEDASDCIAVLDSIDLPNGRSYSFDYDHDQGFLTKVTLPSGGYIEYDYYGGNSDHDVAHNYVVARRSSADGSTEVEWTYARTTSGSDRIVTMTDPEDHVVIHTFDTDGYETATVWKNDSSADPSRIVETTRGSAGQPSTIVTTMDNLHQQQTMTWPGIRMTESTQSDWYSGNDPDVAKLSKTLYTYTSNFPYFPSQTELQGWNGSSYVTQGKTQLYYDQYSLSSVTGTVPNHHSPLNSIRLNLTTIRRYRDASNYIEEHLHYDVLGNVVEHVDARGKSTTSTYTDNYDDSTNHYSYAFPTVVTNAEGHDVETTYNFDTGLPVSVLDPRNLETVFTYDLMNRPLTITEPNDRVTSYTYTDETPKVEEQVTVASGVVRKTETTMDKLYRPILTTLYDPAGNVSVNTEYDDSGPVKRVSAPYRGETPSVWTETDYDVLGRPVMITNPDSTTVDIVYDGNAITVTNEAGIERRNTHNSLGQLILVEEPNPDLTPPWLETTYSYYVFGPLAEVTQGDQTRTFTSDWLGRITSESHPETGTTSYTYFEDGLVETRTDARDIVTTYAYDDIGRIYDVTYSDDGGVTPDLHYRYDENGFIGFLTTAKTTDPTTGPPTDLTTSILEYDNAGNLTQESVSLNGVTGTFTTAYTYDRDGRLLTVTYPSGRVVTQSYAASGGIASDRTASLSDSTTSTTLLQSVEDNAAGQITNRTLGSGITETRTFNARNQLTRIAAAANSATLLDMGYGYGTSNDGRIRARTDGVQPEHSANYTFDPIGRLTEVSGGDNASWGVAWALDRYGNRTAQTPAGLASGRVGSPSSFYGSPNTTNHNAAWMYDDAGNVTNDTAHTYSYDAESRLIQIDSSSTQYAYDDAGRRIKKITNGVTTYYFYGLTGLMSEFSTASGASGAASTDRLQYRVGEQTGTAVMLVASDGNARENNRVFPFGEPWNTFAESNNKDKFATYQRDQESGEAGLDYAMARYYASQSGRFTTADPGHVGAELEDPQSWNAYAYALNDPIDFTDPEGLFPWKKLFRIVAAALSYFVPPAAPFLVPAAIGVGAVPSGPTPPFNPGAAPLGPGLGIPPFIPGIPNSPNSTTVVFGTPPYNPAGGNAFAPVIVLGVPIVISTGELIITAVGATITAAILGKTVQNVHLAKGDKSPEELKKKKEDVDMGRRRIRELREKLKRATGPKSRRPIQDQINREIGSVKGHQKQIQQKWGIDY